MLELFKDGVPAFAFVDEGGGRVDLVERVDERQWGRLHGGREERSAWASSRGICAVVGLLMQLEASAARALRSSCSCSVLPSAARANNGQKIVTSERDRG